MKAKDVMTQPVISVTTGASFMEAIRVMLQYKISGLPVVDAAGNLVGMVSEGDFLRRVETATLRRRPRWIEFFVGPGQLADEYVHASGRKVDEVMTPDVHAATEDTPLEEIVRLMERHRIKRVPVLRGTKPVGIVTRANLMRALIRSVVATPATSTDDAVIRQRLLDELNAQPWAPVGAIDVSVSDGVVTLSGVITDDRQRLALRVAAENIPGVRKVEDRLAWVIPEAGLVGTPAVVVGPPRH